MSPEISAFAAKDLMEKTRRHDEAFWNIIVVSSGTVSSNPHIWTIIYVKVPNANIHFGGNEKTLMGLDLIGHNLMIS